MAQEAPILPQAEPPAPGFLSRYHFHLNAARLGIDDERFSWDADFGGDVDLWDFGRGRINFLANYKTVLGDELRAFDPNQGSYTLDFRLTGRAGVAEIAGVFHHVSRHLSDRPRSFSIDWNMAGVEASLRQATGQTRMQGSVRALATVRKSFVDYRGEVAAQGSVMYPAPSRVAFLAGASVIVIPVDRDVFDRGAQSGGRIEAGVRIAGTAGALELFGGFERRIDAHPLEHEPKRWGMLGFRLVSP